MFRQAFFLVVLHSLVFAGTLHSQDNGRFYQLQITDDSYGHEWPSINNDGVVVWSQLDDNGYYQVWLQDSPLLGGPREQITMGNQNHEQPVIDDNGDILYFQDNTGAGAGYEVILLNASGVQSVLEFSSSNPPGCTPPACNSWHTAGQNFGIASNGTAITYFDFCTNPGPVCKRRFDVSGIGELQCAGAPCDFSAYDYPSINSSGVVTVASVGSSPSLYYFNAGSPAFPLQIFGSGTAPHIADDTSAKPKPQVVSISESGTVQSGYLLISDASYSPASVSYGEWVGVNNSDLITYSQLDNNLNTQVWVASTANGVDMQCPPADWSAVLKAYTPRYVVADAWGGVNQFPAETTLSGAQAADPSLHLGAYAVMNFYSKSFPSGNAQIGEALFAIGPLAGSLDFLAVDLEPCGANSNPTKNCIKCCTNNCSKSELIKTCEYNPAGVASRVKFINNAVKTIKDADLKPVIYTSHNLWEQVTGSNVAIGSCSTGGKCLRLWDARYDDVPSLFLDQLKAGLMAWTGYGGWNWTGVPPNPRFGKQYSSNCQIGQFPPNCKNTLLPTDEALMDDLSTITPDVCAGSEKVVDLDVFDPRIFQ